MYQIEFKRSENPADLVTLGLRIEEIKLNKLYWEGPWWLSHPESTWPNSKEKHERIECAKEVKSSTAVLVTQKILELNLKYRFEKYLKIVRVVAQILKWRKTVPRTISGILTATDIHTAEMCLFRHLQLMYFCEEYELLSMNKQLCRKSTILSPDPIFYFHMQLIIVGGRLNKSTFPEETTHPIILPCNVVLIEKLILHIHEGKSRCSVETIFCILRQTYWVIRGRQEVTNAIKRCVICRHHNIIPLQPKMGDLPADRINAAPAFSHIGLDFTGPFY